MYKQVIWSLVTATGEVEAELQQRIMEGSKVLVTVKSVVKGKKMCWGVNKTLCQQFIVPTVT